MAGKCLLSAFCILIIVDFFPGLVWTAWADHTLSKMPRRDKVELKSPHSAHQAIVPVWDRVPREEGMSFPLSTDAPSGCAVAPSCFCARMSTAGSPPSSHFTDEQIESQRSSMICLSHTAKKWTGKTPACPNHCMGGGVGLDWENWEATPCPEVLSAQEPGSTESLVMDCGIGAEARGGGHRGGFGDRKGFRMHKGTKQGEPPQGQRGEGHFLQSLGASSCSV